MAKSEEDDVRADVHQREPLRREVAARLQHEVDESVADREQAEDAGAPRARAASGPSARRAQANRLRGALARRPRLARGLRAAVCAHVGHEEPEDRDADHGERERRDEDRVVAVRG